MESIAGQRVVWALHRLHLRQGATAWAISLAVVTLVGLALSTANIASQLATTRAQAQARIAELQQIAHPAAPARIVDASSMPLASTRFPATDRMFEAMATMGIAPEQVRFRYETSADAGLARQVAVFTVKASWREVSDLLAQLQAQEPTAYIAKLHVVRENADDAQVSAEIQLALVTQGDVAVTGAAK